MPLFDSTFPITLALANNKMGPGGSYLFRRFWKENGMPTLALDPEPIDYWYDKLYHGRIDDRGVIVYPSENNLKQIPAKDGTYWALDFVVDAFVGLQLHMEQALLRGAISGAGNITMLYPKRAWVSIHKDYNSYMENLYDHIVTFWFQKKQRNLKIKNFSDFLQEFMELVDTSSGILPFTKSAHILSKYFSPLSGGLAIEVAEDSHSQDIIKQKRWVKDPNFTFYKKAAANFGFLVDKNAPWRLVADINSPIMKKYMEPYGVTGANLFETYYYKSHLFDIETLKRYLIEMYNAYVIAFPSAKEFRTKRLGSGGIKTVSRLVDRYATNIEDVNHQYGPEFWLKTYYYIRLREMGAPRNPVEFNKTLEKIIQVYKLFDFDRALDYTNDRIRRVKVV